MKKAFVILVLILILIGISYYYFRPKTSIPKSVAATKHCFFASDCVAVDCGCVCSGCGGFPYDDVINKKYEDIWYEQQGCAKEKMCLTACCSPRSIACEKNVCVVKEGVPTPYK